MSIRPQYHFRNSEQGLLAWDVVSLIEKTASLSPLEVPLSEISEIEQPYWFELEGDSPTCSKIAEHARLIEEADLSFPIIVDHEGRIMDGMHRVCKALNLGLKTVPAFRLPKLPPPDFIGVAPSDIPCEE